MLLTRRRILAIASAGVLLLNAAPAIAQDDTPPPPHVRSDSARLRAMIDDAARRSPEMRRLIDQLQALEVTVYVRTRIFAQIDLEGRVALLSAGAGRRYLVVELACGRTGFMQMATLGHELYHALEIAREPSVVDAPSLAAFYRRIGLQTGDAIGRQTFETDAAADAGRRTRQQLLSNPIRSSNGS